VRFTGWLRAADQTSTYLAVELGGGVSNLCGRVGHLDGCRLVVILALRVSGNGFSFLRLRALVCLDRLGSLGGENIVEVSTFVGDCKFRRC
jgi:hypothetical protein